MSGLGEFWEQFVELDAVGMDVGCGCGFMASGVDPLVVWDEFERHECPLRGVELTAEEIWGMACSIGKPHPLQANDP